MTDYRRTLAGRRQRWFGLKPLVKTGLSARPLHPLLRVAARLVPGIRAGRLPAPAGLAEVAGTAAGARFVLVDPGRCEIAKEFYWGGGRRPDPADALALDIVTALARRAAVLLDVGAYTGVFTVAAAAANPGLRVHAFEMVPAVVAGLQRNIDRNGIADRVRVHPTGVGASGTRMRVPSGEGGSALPSFYSAHMEFAEGFEVEFLALDDLLAEVDEHAGAGAAGAEADRGRGSAGGPGSGGDAGSGGDRHEGAGAPGQVVMKIDVEGAEDAVLEHGQELLARHRPDILCEVLHGQADGRALEALLAPNGYRWYLVRADDIAARERIVPDPVHRDWLFSARTPAALEADLGRIIV